jgi:hypothetical protein
MFGPQAAVVLSRDVGVGLGDGERRRVAAACVVARWLAGVNMLHPARVRLAARQQNAAVRRA